MQNNPSSKISWKLDAFLALATWALVVSYFVILSPGYDQAVRTCLSSFSFSKDLEWDVLFSNLGAFVGAVGVTLAVALSYVALGKRIARGLGLGWIPIPIRFALGALAFGGFFLSLGLCGLWFRLILWLTLLVGILFGLWDLLKEWRRKEEGLTLFDWSRWIPSWGPARFALFAALPIPFLVLALGFLPDVFYDTQVYHLAVPEAWMLHHGFCDLPERVFASFPYLGELILLPGGWLTAWSDEPWIGTSAPRLMGLVAWVLTAVLAGHWAKKLAQGNGDDGETSGLVACLLTIGCPLFCMIHWNTQVEGVLMLMGLSFLYAMDRFSQSAEGKGLGWAVAAGLLFGATVMVKYNGILLGVFVVPWLFIFRRKKDLRPFFIALLGAFVLVTLPWALKNWVYAGNPVVPYLSHLFGGRSLSPEGLRQWMAEQREWHVQEPWDWLTLPWRLVMTPPTGYNFVGPLPWVCLVWLLCTRRRLSSEKFLAWGCLLAFTVGLSITHLLRFEAALFPPLFTVAAAAVASRPLIRRSFLSASGLACLGFLPLLFGMLTVYDSPQGVWTGREDVNVYLHRAGVTPYMDLVDWTRDKCDSTEKILLVGDARTLRYGRDVLAGTVFDEPLLVSAAREEADAEGIFRRVKRRGVDVILVNLREGIRVGATYRWYALSQGDWNKLNGFFEKYTDLVSEGDLSQLYRLRKVAVEKPFRRPSTIGILFLDPVACDYVKAVRAVDAEASEKALMDLCERQTFTPQWWAEKAGWYAQEGKGVEALGAWKKASTMGIMTKEQYQAWAREAQSQKKNSETTMALREEKKWYGVQ